MTPTTLKDMWVCTRKVYGEEVYDHCTLRYFKKDSIEALLENGSMIWKEAKKYGWRCIKTDITFNPVQK